LGDFDSLEYKAEAETVRSSPISKHIARTHCTSLGTKDYALQSLLSNDCLKRLSKKEFIRAMPGVRGIKSGLRGVARQEKIVLSAWESNPARARVVLIVDIMTSANVTNTPAKMYYAANSYQKVSSCFFLNQSAMTISSEPGR
jgi:hypothetical protein